MIWIIVIWVTEIIMGAGSYWWIYKNYQEMNQVQASWSRFISRPLPSAEFLEVSKILHQQISQRVQHQKESLQVDFKKILGDCDTSMSVLEFKDFYVLSRELCHGNSLGLEEYQEILPRADQVEGLIVTVQLARHLWNLCVTEEIESFHIKECSHKVEPGIGVRWDLLCEVVSSPGGIIKVIKKLSKEKLGCESMVITTNENQTVRLVFQIVLYKCNDREKSSKKEAQFGEE